MEPKPIKSYEKPKKQKKLHFRDYQIQLAGSLGNVVFFCFFLVLWVFPSVLLVLPSKPASQASQAGQPSPTSRSSQADSLSSLWNPFWSHICNLGTTFGAPWVHFSCKKITWGARGATRDAEVEFPKIELPFGTFVDSFF
jgi:hypothetical protein